MQTETLFERVETLIDQTPVIEQPTLKIITWETNYNQKLNCKAMVHIDVMPGRIPSHSELDGTIVEIRTADESFLPSRWRLYDMLFAPFKTVNDIMAFTSHGMTSIELSNMFFNKYHPKFNWNTEIAVYFYLRREEKKMEN